MKKPLTSVLDIDEKVWNKLLPDHNPFLKREFFLALEESGSIGKEAGWIPLFFLSDDQKSLIYGFIKSHSYGEYIFDWEWARAYQQNGLQYYPKISSMLPFTPVNTTPFIMSIFDPEAAKSLLNEFELIYESNNLSSVHFLFIKPDLKEFFKEQGYFIRESMQYHFFNQDFMSFDDYLNTLKTKKAKNVRLERSHSELIIQKITGKNLNSIHAKQLYEFYLSTIDHKQGIDYLKEEFFIKIFETMKDNVLYVEARKDNRPVAGSLFFYDQIKLYGRYWGSNLMIENLHFELCYYQGIDFCIERGLKVFEAGAQGEHKIARGFRPTRIYSAHKIKNANFSQAIGRYIEEEKTILAADIEQLSSQLPFRNI